MARHETDREDLFAEAAALVRKIEGGQPMALVGFRADGTLVAYFGPEQMFQLDAAGRLRRAFHAGCLYRPQGDTFARLTRQRADDETTLVRHDLTPAELADFRQVLLTQIGALEQSLIRRTFVVTRRTPADDHEVETAIVERLQHARRVDDWIAPAFRGKR